MENTERFYEVRSIHPITIAFSSGLQSVFWFILTYQHYQSWTKGWSGPASFWLALAAAAVMLVTALVSVWQMFRPAYTLEMNEDSIQLRRRRLAADEIKRIYVSWGDDPAISVKPRKWLFVPNDYTFKFSGNPAQSLRELIHWASENEVSIVKRRSSKIYD